MRKYTPEEKEAARLRRNEKARERMREKRNDPEVRAYHRQYYRDNRHKWWKLRGIEITGEQADALLESQNYRCAICEITQEEYGRSFAVDHCHKTGRVRGIICRPCNTGIGGLRDDPELTRKATAYLERYN